MSELTAERLRELLDYEPTTGQFTWKVHKSTRIKPGMMAGAPSRGYIVLRVDRVLYQGARLAWLHIHGRWPSGDIDHINGQRADNRIANLRDVPHKVNLQNLRRVRPDSKSGFMGVQKYAAGWRARIRWGGKNVHLGCYQTPEEAHAAYLDGKRRLHEGCTI